MNTRGREYDWAAYEAMKCSGNSPQEAINRALQEGYERLEVWLMLRHVYGFDRAMQKAAWLDANGIEILAEYRQRLDEVTKGVRAEAESSRRSDLR